MSRLVRSGARAVTHSPPANRPLQQQTQQHNNKSKHNKPKMSCPGSHGGSSNSSKGIFPPLPPDNQRRPVTPEGGWRIVVKSRGVRDERIDDKPLSCCSVDDDNIHEDSGEEKNYVQRQIRRRPTRPRIEYLIRYFMQFLD